MIIYCIRNINNLNRNINISYYKEQKSLKISQMRLPRQWYGQRWDMSVIFN